MDAQDLLKLADEVLALEERTADARRRHAEATAKLAAAREEEARAQADLDALHAQRTAHWQGVVMLCKWAR